MVSTKFDYDEQVEKVSKDGAFSELRQAVEKLQEAQLNVSGLADMLAGGGPPGTADEKQCEACGGELGNLYLMAATIRAQARVIIYSVDRVRRHAS